MGRILLGSHELVIERLISLSVKQSTYKLDVEYLYDITPYLPQGSGAFQMSGPTDYCFKTAPVVLTLAPPVAGKNTRRCCMTSMQKKNF